MFEFFIQHLVLQLYEEVADGPTPPTSTAQKTKAEVSSNRSSAETKPDRLSAPLSDSTDYKPECRQARSLSPAKFETQTKEPDIQSKGNTTQTCVHKAT